jgi:ribose transport system permease protein
MTSFIKRQGMAVIAALLLAIILTAYFAVHPRGLTVSTATIWANQVFVLAMVAAGQAIVVFTRSLDLSVGAILALCNCVAARLVEGAPFDIVLGLVATVLVGATCGLVNGVVVLHGKVQPIIATLATGAIFTGVALAVMPIPGGSVSAELSDLLTSDLAGLVPTSLVLMALCVLLLWGIPAHRRIGRAIYAVGSSREAARISGLRTDGAFVMAYVLAGIFAAIGGIFLGLQTLSGDPNVGLPYTLNSIAAVVIGGVALTGGQGSVAGAVIGALILQTIGGLLFFTGVDPLAQPLVQGLVLAIAVSAGGLSLLKQTNRLEAFR